MPRVSIRLLASAGLFLAALAFTPRSLADGPILGFSPEAAREQLELEARFDGHLRIENLRDWMKMMTAKPRHVGAPFTHETAEFMAERFRAWGYEVAIEEYRVLFPTPAVRELEMVEPYRFSAVLEEPELAEDATSGVTRNRLPLYNAYSADGDVTAELVYVNYGVPADYEKLERLGIDVAGKIVIARYGGSWRGIKPKVAAEHGAIGCILYSDPRDDGYYQGDVYPEGPYRMEYGGQRGSVADMPLYPGDPLTPGVGATEDAERMAIEESPTVMKIPVLPISYADATPLLEAMEGPVAPESWRGALPITYHVGPGPATVHLRLEFDWSLAPAYNVIATMRGSEYPDQWVIRGNHFDGWAFGARDPISGMVVVMEEARAVGELARSGWAPKRTIVYAGWDAEEPGLLGSTEWAEHHAEELRRKAVIYINSDSNTRGFLRVGGSHSLERFVNQIATMVDDPLTGVSAAERLRARRLVEGDLEVDATADLRINPLGSGSDYTPFLQHLGIASLDIRFTGEGGGGSYHSIYDSYDHYTRFSDPTFEYGITLAKFGGRAVLRFANSDVLPFRFGNFAEAVGHYLDEVMELAEKERRRTERHNGLVAENAYQLAVDPTETYVAPEPLESAPYLNFAPLENARARLEGSAARYDAALAATMEMELARRTAEEVNEILIRSERLMTRKEGLPRRPWFKHQIYAPGFYTGYGVKTLPGVREAIEQRDWAEAEEQIVVIAETLDNVAAALSEAANMLEARSGGS